MNTMCGRERDGCDEAMHNALRQIDLCDLIILLKATIEKNKKTMLQHVSVFVQL